MRGRTKIFSEKDVIEKAINIFWRKGYEAASTEELLEAMGIGKGSFYNSFPGGKKELFEKAIDQFSVKALETLRKSVEQSTNPLQEIKDFFRSIASDRKEAHMKGCFLGNTIVEQSLIDVELREKAAQYLKQLEILFTEVILKEKQSGRLKSEEDPRLLALYLLTIWNGLAITRRIYPYKSVLEPLIKMLLKIIT